jgi:3-hydroxyisobutyrate dehydrogenase-like beta-hydroxyacid dehydrogenase
MATAVGKAGFALHSWARRPASLDALGNVAYTAHATLKDLAAASDMVALCVSTDDDVFQLLEGGILHALRPGSIVVNHGTGTPANARRMEQLGVRAGVEVLDAPVSGGRPAAEERRLTTMVGGTAAAAARAEPIFAAFSRHVVHLGPAGSGQMTKLLNDALLMMNQAAVADIVTLADELRLDPLPLVEVLKLSSASSAALTLLNTMVRLDNVDHLSAVEALDMELFDRAVRDAGAEARDVTARALAGARWLPALLRRLNPDGLAAADDGRGAAS